MTEKSLHSDVVIIGGVACGPKTAATLARRDGDLKITVFQREKEISYGSCGFPYFASGDIESFQALTETSYYIPRTPEFFRKTKGFEVVTRAEVINIDRADKCVTVKNLDTGEQFEHGYNYLVIATGGNPTSPPFPIPECDRVRPFTRPDDVINFRKKAQQGMIGKALIIGGGFIGCELAEATGSLWGIETVLVERENQILPYVLDKDMAEIARRELQRQDVEVITGAEVEKVELDADGNPVVSLANHDPITTDYVFLCLGVKPETKLAAACGLNIGATGAIEVNAHLQTSDPAIYAGGDCIESVHRLTGRKLYMPMGSLANRHGRVIAENLAGNETTFPNVTGAFFVKIYDINVGAVGLSVRSAHMAGLKPAEVWGAFPDRPDYYPDGNTMTLKMVYEPESGRVLGLQAVGAGDIFRRIDTMSALLQSGATLDDVLEFEHGYAPPYSEAIDPLHHLAALAQAAVKRYYKFESPVGEFAPAMQNAVWLDVRETAEVEASPWPKAGKRPVISIPLNELRDRIGELDKDKDIWIVCKRGPRSYQAAVILRQHGFDNVRIIGGGYQAAVE